MTAHQNPTELPVNIALAALTRSPFSIVLTNPRLKDNPIVYANRAFAEVTGYSNSAVIGRNCRFLQGEATEEGDRVTLRKAIADGEEISVDIVNYSAKGERFKNRLMIAPLHDENGELAFFMGVQMRMDGAADGEPELDPTEDERIQQALVEIQHRVKNHLAMIVSMIRLQAGQAKRVESEKQAAARDGNEVSRSDSAKQNFDTLARRVETLQLLYEELSSKADERLNSEEIALGAYLSRVANAIAHVDGRRGVRVNIDADAITVPFETATRMGLLLSELMTNAMQHAFKDRDAGIVEVRVKELSNATIRIQVSDDGCGLPEGHEWPKQGGLGSRIVRQLVNGLHGSLSVAQSTVGTLVTIDTPHDAGSVHHERKAARENR